MNNLIWTAQIVLAGTFFISGVLRLFSFLPGVHALQARVYGAVDMTPTNVRIVGLLEILLALGVMVPDISTSASLGHAFLIARLCAAGLALFMVASGIFHIRRRESAALAISAFLLALFVIVGRWPY